MLPLGCHSAQLKILNSYELFPLPLVPLFDFLSLETKFAPFVIIFDMEKYQRVTVEK